MGTLRRSNGASRKSSCYNRCWKRHGSRIALELARRKAKLALVDFRKETLAETSKMVDALDAKNASFVLDVSDAKAVLALPEAVKKALGEADVLINNAGIIQPFVMAKDLSLEDAHHVMNVNFTGPLMLTKAFLPGLISRPVAHILNVSSLKQRVGGIKATHSFCF